MPADSVAATLAACVRVSPLLRRGRYSAVMSAITEYARLRPVELAHLRQLLVEAPDEAYAFVGDLADRENQHDQTPRGTDIDKAGPGLAYLLGQLAPPVDVIGGGTALTDREWGYDAPRLLTTEEVITASRFLDQTPFVRLAERYVPAELTAASVYPDIWSVEWALEYLEEAYIRLTAFFHAASIQGDSILIWTS